MGGHRWIFKCLEIYIIVHRGLWVLAVTYNGVTHGEPVRYVYYADIMLNLINGLASGTFIILRSGMSGVIGKRRDIITTILITERKLGLVDI